MRPNETLRRNIGHDGMVTIVCSECGAEICRTVYRGFSTALCTGCQGVTPPTKHEDPLVALQREVVAQRQAFGEKLNEDKEPIALRIKAVGFKRRKVVAEETGSALTAKNKKRRPLLIRRENEENQ